MDASQHENRAPMKFRIDYVSRRKPAKLVDETHFARSVAFYPVLQLEVGQRIERRYTSAGYRRITRVA